LEHRASSIGGELADREAKLERTEAKIRRLIGKLSDGDGSDYIREEIDILAAAAKAEKAAIASLGRQARRPPKLPTVDEVERLVRTGMDSLLAEDVNTARELLRRLFKGGTIGLHPDAAGTYTARSRVLPEVLLAENTNAPTGGQGAVYYSFRSGGAQPAQVTQ